MKPLRILAILNLFSLLLNLGLSYTTQRKLINNIDVGQVSDRYPSLFTPAPVTFSIWAVIYTALVLFCIYHIVMAFRYGTADPANTELTRIGGWFILNNIVTAAWLIAWVYEHILLSLVLIGIQLITLIAMHIRAGIYDPNRTAASKIFTQLPLSIYFGWITIATIANTSIYLVSINWDGLGKGISPGSWTMIVIIFAVLIGFLVVLGRRNVFYGLVIIWALYGIILARKAAEPGATNLAIIKTAWVGMIVMAAACLVSLIRNLFSKTPRTPFPVATQPLK